MSAPFVIPFNFSPSENPSLKTGSYTVPAGKYAFVNPQTADFSINSQQVYPSISLNIGPNFGQTVNYTNATGEIFITTLTYQKNTSGTGTAGLNVISIVGGVSYTVASASRTTVGSTLLLTNTTIATEILQLQAIGSGAGGGASATVQVTGTAYAFIGKVNDFWVKSGAVLNGFGYTVTEYNSIS